MLIPYSQCVLELQKNIKICDTLLSFKDCVLVNFMLKFKVASFNYLYHAIIYRMLLFSEILNYFIFFRNILALATTMGQ